MSDIRKIALVVEGLTEASFIEKFVREIFTENQVSIRTIKRDTSKKGNNWVVISSESVTDNTKFFFLIVNCSTDSKVKSYINENRKTLIDEGFEKIVGLIDLYPLEKSDFHKHSQGLYYRVPQVPIPTVFVISIMEIETWFLAETSHFERIHQAITVERINTDLGIDLGNIDFEEIPAPAKLLNDIYHLEGFAYRKRATNIQRTVDAIDYSRMYFDVPVKVPSLQLLVDLINEIIT